MLSILTFFSTPILEKIFGNGAVEVDHHHSLRDINYCKKGEEWDAMPSANVDPAEDEVKHLTVECTAAVKSG